MKLGRLWLDGFRRRAAAVALIALSHAFAVGAAEPGTAPTAAEKDTARALARDGDSLFAERQFEPALARYSAAYHLVRVPTLGLQVAKTQMELARLADALRTAREVENMPQQPSEPAVFGTARKTAKELARDLSARVPRVLVQVAPSQATARVSIDGAPAPSATSDTGAELDPGVHRLIVSADGYSNVELEFELEERDRERLPVTLFPTAGGAAPAVSAPSKAAAPSSNDPPQEPPEPAASAQDERRDAADAARSARTRGYVALGIGALAAGAGTVTGILAFSTKPDCPNDSCDAAQSDEIEDSKRFGNIATVSFAVSGACLAYALWELIANGDAGEDSASASSGALRAGVAPRDDGGLLLQVGGAF